jgi:FKBP-type peptidyl-prolyl cis-trans isomerase
MKWFLLTGFIALLKISFAQAFSLQGAKAIGDSIYVQKVERGSGQKVKRGGYVLLHTVFLTGRDSLIFDSRVFNDGPVEYRIHPKEDNPLVTGLLQLRGGDSAIIAFPARLLYDEKKPGFYDKTLWMKYRVRVHRAMDSITLAAEKYRARQKRIAREADTITKHLFDRGLAAPYRTPAGVFIAWHHRGQGVSPQQGDYISLHYRGYLMDGKVFDNSWDRDEPFQYVVGEMELIEGWREVIPYLTEGDSVTVAIPSPLAYGGQGAGGAIPPNSILLFDMKLVEASNDAYQYDKDTTAIKRYLRQHGIQAQIYDNGVAVSIIDTGHGLQLQAGDVVTLQYHAKLLEGQIVEDHRAAPLKFRLNTGTVPHGLEFALRQLTTGTEALILLPSRLAYGATGSGHVPSDSILIYKVKIRSRE